MPKWSYFLVSALLLVLIGVAIAFSIKDVKPDEKFKHLDPKPVVEKKREPIKQVIFPKPSPSTSKAKIEETNSANNKDFRIPHCEAQDYQNLIGLSETALKKTFYPADTRIYKGAAQIEKPSRWGAQLNIEIGNDNLVKRVFCS